MLKSIKSLFCITLVFFAQSNVFSNEESSSEDVSVSSLLRTTIIVRDLDAALEFFQQILGLNVRLDLPLEGPTANTILGTKDKRGRIVILQSGNEVMGNIALLAYLDEPIRSEEDHDAKLDVGEVVLVMETNNIDAIYRTVEGKGYTIVSSPMVTFERPNMISQSREIIFIGPEGIAINLIQRGIRAETKAEEN